MVTGLCTALPTKASEAQLTLSRAIEFQLLPSDPIGEDKINYRIESVKKSGQFRVAAAQNRIDITFSDGTTNSLGYTIKGSELWIWPPGNKLMAEGYRKSIPENFSLTK